MKCDDPQTRRRAERVVADGLRRAPFQNIPEHPEESRTIPNIANIPNIQNNPEHPEHPEHRLRRSPTSILTLFPPSKTLYFCSRPDLPDSPEGHPCRSSSSYTRRGGARRILSWGGCNRPTICYSSHTLSNPSLYSHPPTIPSRSRLIRLNRSFI
jgi:hypothetical protein